MPAQIQYRLRKVLKRVLRQKAFEEDFLPLLPPTYHDVARFVFFDRPTETEQQFAQEMESLRAAITERYTGTMTSYTSPHSGTFNLDEAGKSQGGPIRAADIRSHARTAVGPAGGILLKRIADAVKATRVLELGTNTGFSGAYLLFSNTQVELVTVEGSADLCSIAEGHLKRFPNRFRILNMLFDEAIDLLSSENGEKFDLVFIDGQHEREATLHYTNRVRPLMREGGVFVFDDIYWSQDMNTAWRSLCENPIFALTMDLGSKGLCILYKGNEIKRHLDLCEYTGRPPIFRKGW